MVMASPATRDSAVSPCFHGCLIFLHRYFPTTISSLTSPQSVSPQSTAALTLGSTIPQLQLLAMVPSRGPAFLSGCRSMYGCLKDCLILIPFRLPQISCLTLTLKCFCSNSDNCPDVGIGLLLQFSHPLRAGPVLLTLLFFFLLPFSYRVCVVLYILFHWSGTPVLSQLVFCMHVCV